MDAGLDASLPADDESEEIHLDRPPLVEAWLELQWRANGGASVLPGFSTETAVDTHFAFALGPFRKQVQGRFPVQESLPTLNIPATMLPPHTVQYRFRSGPEQWPLLQIGPGIATVNFVTPYSWTMFRNEALFLRKVLLEAYDPIALEPMQIILRYRNLFSIDPQTNDTFRYLRENLNLHLSVPEQVGDQFVQPPWPTDFNLSLGYTLQKPNMQATMRLATAVQHLTDAPDKPVLLAELEVRDRQPAGDTFTESETFMAWLSTAHSVIHRWFFALIAGPLLNESQ